MFIYAGKPSSQYKQFGNEARIQFNDAFVDVRDVQPSVYAGIAEMNEELQSKVVVGFKSR